MLFHTFRVSCGLGIVLLVFFFCFESLSRHFIPLSHVANVTDHQVLPNDENLPLLSTPNDTVPQATDQITPQVLSESLTEHKKASQLPKNYWTPRDGKFLPSVHILISQNRHYTLSLAHTSELLIHRQGENRPIFWSNNGFHWLGLKWAEITEDGYFTTLHKEKSDTEAGKTWSSGLWRECQKSPPEGSVAMVMLTDRGALRVLHVSEDLLGQFEEGFLDEDAWSNDVQMMQTVCEPFAGDPERIKKEGKEDMGRLAVVIVGALRDYRKTCADMDRKIFDKWPGSGGVDIFVATLDEDIWLEEDEIMDWPSISKDLKACFGDRFKGLEHEKSASVEFPDLDASRRCKTSEPLTPDRLLNMQYHVERGRQMIMKYMIKNSVKYDYILRMRPDHLVWGDEVPPFEPMDTETIYYPMQYWDDPVWTTSHTGTSGLAPSDQAAFGRFIPMSIYLSLYNSFANIIKTTQLSPSIEESSWGDLTRKDLPPFGSPPCFEPTNPCPYETQWPCFIEGVMGYWPALHGIRIKMDWRWKWNLLRKDGSLAKDWHGAWNKSQGTRLVNNAFD